MGVPLRLAVSAAVLAALVFADQATSHMPVNQGIRDLNTWINSWVVPHALQKAVSFNHVLVTYLRNLIAGTLVYHISANLWGLWIYVISPPEGLQKPTRATILEQIYVAQTSIFSYVILPLFGSLASEKGWNLAYSSMSEVGLPMYSLYFAAFLFLVEVGIYWTHRWLHEIKFLYNNVHLPHHKYNKPNELSPYASIAFHPLDGILQALPYVLFTFVVPMHYLTSLVMLFFSGIWATSIHDAVNAVGTKVPIMGAHYHTAHHVYYKCNYGQFFVACDWYWNTLRVPKEKKAA